MPMLGVSWTDFWMGVASSLLATVIALAFAMVYKEKFGPVCASIKAAYRLYFVLGSIRMSRFTRCREDYTRFSSNAKSVGSYIKQARRTLRLVSVSLVTGVKFQGMCPSLRELVERSQPVEVYISLLDFRNTSLMVALAPALDMTVDELRQAIKSSFVSFFEFKNTLSQSGQAHFHVNAHRSIPFASAIIIDEKETFGRLQIETKPYKVALDDSWGFELIKGGSHKMFETLTNSYVQLINDGEELKQGMQATATSSGNR